MSERPRRHLVVPDTQIKPGVPLEHIEWIAQYAVEKRPDVLVLIGDWADMASLSSYDVGTKKFEGRAIAKDLEVANRALAMLMGPIDKEIARREKFHRERWNLRKVITLGNHEDRISRAVNTDSKLDGLVKMDDLLFKQYGFEVYPFLQPVVIDGIAYCHYFASGVMGRPITTARALITKQHMSCFQGHIQIKDIAYGKRGDGKRLTAIISGCAYLHDEDYLNPQTNDVWRGIWMLNEVNDGAFDEMPVSLRFLEERYKR
jgi:hypothetical protein